ncbi:DUF6157 family protein [Asticcacaulis sp. BYS171W]|uniref:DUF6157 family protein n=1 Tax=Asticcacaulis aquaticus TaxID=2984212 RepID=A0ABT5HW77_9CAUL|nr:DUF6157 family protein [Asticcacaulis aquaticus]MDC7684325.1 DUF6157 family protein [Asticcacaulis aquaticus]
MKITNTFITIAEDSKTRQGTVPPHKDGPRTLARLHFDLLEAHPYEYTIDDLNFTVHALKNGIDREDVAARAAFLSKGHPCMRASPLTKTYGFGAHYNHAGKIAIYPADSVAYHKFLKDPEVRVEKAMRNRRAVETA